MLAAWRFMRRENLLRMAAIVAAMVVAGGLGIAWFEPGVNLGDGLWWSVVTLTTVGYGDISPASTGGRVIAVLIMLLGIGLLGMLSATLAGVFVTNRMREYRGMGRYPLSGHIIIVEWNHRARAVLQELRADRKTAATPVVLIAECAEKPVDDDNLFFVRGVVDEETLEKAGVAQASTVIVLGDDSLEATARDAKVVLSTLTIENIAPDVYTVAELVDERHARHCRLAKVDEVIVGSELSSHLIASAAIDHGVSTVISELLSARRGNELYRVPLPQEMDGLDFLDVIIRMKKERHSIVIGLRRGDSGEFITNPAGDCRVRTGDDLLVIAPDR